ncbi:hypothetical protein [Streptomyces sp. NPDC014733]|uniref:hypothetical protein n=1 Tax=Streptomyces sp. NPDC014733 TaxID=3364885 RepID=UPI0036F7CF5A
MTTSPIRRRTALLSAALLTGTCAASLTLAAPARAEAVCLVNGLPPVIIGNVINGTPGNDVITCAGLPLDYTVNGLGGNDTIRVLELLSNGTVDGGDGDDTITVGNPLGATSGVLRGGPGDDTVTVIGHLDGISISGAARVEGNAGDDTLTAGVVTRGGFLLGGDGNDALTADTVGDSAGISSAVNGEAGDDTIRVRQLNATQLHGGSGNDLVKSSLPDILGNPTPVTVTNGGFVHGDGGSDTCTTAPASANNCEQH